MNRIDTSDFSNGKIETELVDGISKFEWKGSAIFDLLVHVVNGNLKVQFDTGRITGDLYAKVYMSSLQVCIEEAMKFLLQKDLINKDLEIKDNELKLQLKDLSLKDADLITAFLSNDLKQAQAGKDLELKQQELDYKNKVYPLELNLKNKELGLREAQLILALKDNETKQHEIDKSKAQTALLLQQKLSLIADDTIKAIDSSKNNEQKQAQINVLKQDKLLKEKQVGAFDAQNQKDLDSKQAQIELYNRQKQGFDDNKLQKLFDTQMNAWALMFSSGLLQGSKPSIITNDAVSSLYTKLNT